MIAKFSELEKNMITGIRSPFISGFLLIRQSVQLERDTFLSFLLREVASLDYDAIQVSNLKILNTASREATSFTFLTNVYLLMRPVIKLLGASKN